MAEKLISYAIQYSVYLLEAGLLSFLVVRGIGKRLQGFFLYIALLFTTDAVARPLILYRYGVSSLQYAYVYWVTDAMLALGAFALVCAFFRRACAGQESMWRQLRLLLAAVFVLVGGISFFALSRNYGHLFTGFIIDFAQNLYFTCLVLNTLLFILLKQIESEDDELELLVSGLGMQFAGLAASYALFYMTKGQDHTRGLVYFIGPLFTLGMLATWFYAVAHTPQVAKVRHTPQRARKLAAVEVPELNRG